MALSGQRFKIDFYNSYSAPFALYRKERRRWLGVKWHMIDRFDSREQCRELYEKVKDLPEYLD